MGWRIMLACVVSGLGLSVPTDDPFDGWAGGAGYCAERDVLVIPEPTPNVVEILAPRLEAAVDRAVVSEPETPRAGDDVVSGLDAPTRPLETAETEAAPADTMDAAFAAARDDVVAGLAGDRLAAVGPGTPRSAEVASVGEPARMEPVEVSEGLDGSDRAGRLTIAVRLTREAVHAWANLLHGPAAVAIEE